MGAQPSKGMDCTECCTQRETTRMKVDPRYCAPNPSPRTSQPGQPVKEVQYGVGLVFRNMRDGKLVVDSFIKDSSAYQSGIVRDGDILTAVNGVNIDTVPQSEIPKLLMGKFESMVELKFSRPVDGKGKTPRKSIEAGNSIDSPTGNGVLPLQQRRVEDAKWASRKMQSYAPAYDTIWVQLSRRTPSDVLNDAAEQAQQEAISKSRGRKA